MLADLDETIRQLLIREVPLDPGEVDVSFEAPDRDWSSRLSRPTVNCFLYDIRENHDIRRTDWERSQNNTAAFRHKPLLRFDSTYQISVWARAPEDEHRLLWRVLLALCRHPSLEGDMLLADLRSQPVALPARVSQPDQTRQNHADLWQSLENRIRPSLTYVVTLALDPDLVLTSPLVLTQIIRVGNGVSDELSEMFDIGGRVHEERVPEHGIGGALVTLRETGNQVTSDSLGRFVLRHVPRGPVTLVVQVGGYDEAVRQLEIPSENYDVVLSAAAPPARKARSRRGDDR